VISGVGAGIGRAIVRRFAARGDAVALEGAHGSFDDRAVTRGPPLWASPHHGSLAAAPALAARLGALARAHGREVTGTTRRGSFEDRMPPVRAIEVVRAGWGLALLLAPSQVLRALEGRGNRRTRTVTRLLGARQLSQAAWSGLRPSRSVLVGGAVIDLVHAGTAMVLGVVDDRWRHVALSDAGIALAWGLAGLRDSGRS